MIKQKLDATGKKLLATGLTMLVAAGAGVADAIHIRREFAKDPNYSAYVTKMKDSADYTDCKTEAHRLDVEKELAWQVYGAPLREFADIGLGLTFCGVMGAYMTLGVLARKDPAIDSLF
ncbi:hypothetical protein KW787_02895 [Candidatus Pacearchaeota archaeon]|nr:hypothetical protein [Candidatus Pacearchaeota archaeon]